MHSDRTRRLDLNADMGESFGVYTYGEDDALLEVITSANIACGFHAGDPYTMLDSVRKAVAHNVRIGAHVGLPDRLGFGRRYMTISDEDAYTYTLYQLAALDGFVRVSGGQMAHVKPHGAMYMTACDDVDIADAIVSAVAEFNRDLAIYALPNSALIDAAKRCGLEVYPEYFADRPYHGTRVQMFDWSYDQIGGPPDAAQRVTTMLHDSAFDAVRTVCVHSDTHGAPDIARMVRRVLVGADIES